MTKLRFFIYLIWALICLAIIVALLNGYAVYYQKNHLPAVDTLRDIQLQVPLRIYSKEGELLGEFGEMRRQPLTLDQIPAPLIAAVLSTEDQRFFEHSGIDPMGLMRAVFELLITGTKSQGGSTITMQVARNFYLTREKTFMRKLNEILLAIKIDRELSKEKVLELYLNKIYLGKRAYGVAAAAQVYYGKTVDQLTLSEMAMIAGLPKAPSANNPVSNPVAAKNRRDHVLARMFSLGYIDKAAYEKAVATPETAKYHLQPIKVRAPYVAEMVRQIMLKGFGDDIYTKGYHVYTTVDAQQQAAANKALTNGLLAYDQRHGYRGPEDKLGKFHPDKISLWAQKLAEMPAINRLKPAVVMEKNEREASVLLADKTIIKISAEQMTWARAKPINVGDVIRVQRLENDIWRLAQIPKVEGALVSLDPNNGAIRAMVGGFDHRKSLYNRAIQAQRQPGSVFKPFIYAAALSKGYTLASIIEDSPLSIWDEGSQKLWEPKNDKDIYRGPVRLLVGLTSSLNTVSIRLLQSIGVPYAIEYISHFGFDPAKLPKGLTLALGTPSLTPLEVTSGFTVFANGGYKVPPFLIERIVDNQGQVLYQAKPKIACTECISDGTSPSVDKADQYAPRVISNEIAFLMTEGMKNVLRHGTGIKARVLERNDLAGKTGTTNDQNDAWFTGFNNDIVTTVWIGFDQPASLREYGGTAALPVWIEYMRLVLTDKPERPLPQPPGIITVTIDASGKPANSGEEGTFEEYFQASNPPSNVESKESTDLALGEPVF